MSGDYTRIDKMFLFKSSKRDCTNGVRTVILSKKTLHIYKKTL
jgi:hypothetical protein